MTDEVDLAAGERYWPLFKFSMKLDPSQHAFCFNQVKTNMLYLIEPRVDTEGVEAARKNPIAESINTYMDNTTDSWLQKLPLEFLGWWIKEAKKGRCQMTQHWPDNHLEIVARRAHIAQRRLLGLEQEGNVIRVNFRRCA